MKTELLPSASTEQTVSNVLTKFRIQMIHLAFSSEHSTNIFIWTFIQFSFWTMRGSFLNVRPNIPGMFHECYRAHWDISITFIKNDNPQVVFFNVCGRSFSSTYQGNGEWKSLQCMDVFNLQRCSLGQVLLYIRMEFNNAFINIPLK